MPEFEIGDKVRVEFEGVLDNSLGRRVVRTDSGSWSVPLGSHLTLIEKRKPRVGDVIKAQTYVDREAEDDFPVGTVVAYSSGDNALSKRSNGKWSHVDEEGENYPLAAPNWDDLTVIFVPHEA